ncbi:prephenate dehydrogenase/arogenate dehydrogenase family protein [Methylobacterium sp. 77]|uniref:prephenate dehydrogenase/arogenate dehydrogenase family protein n=1 Tax=Methylobacterium sp. 77 TaxID=1101192 RepID=UPI0003A2CA59|nr:prephenate dehydrogenase/arogenate dehydrogenase family protein [Methylobacterium sp. 77]
MSLLISPSSSSPVGIIGFGAFGRLIAQHLGRHFPLRAYDPALPQHGSDDGATLGTLAEVAACPVVVLAAPVSNLAEVVSAIAPLLRHGALVLDVGSVKMVAAQIMAEGLPDHVDIVATHPLFGPQSARSGLKGLKIAICPIRGQGGVRVAAFLRKCLGLDVILTDPEAHDRAAASVQGLTHLIAKVFVEMEPLPTRMTTRSFDLLMQAVGMVRHDAPEVFDAIERANPYAADVRHRFFAHASRLARELSQPRSDAMN